MTDEMKENIIKYLTGNITEEEPSDYLVYSDVKSTANDLSSQLDDEFGSGNWSITDIVQGKTSSGIDNELSLLYGMHEEDNNGTTIYKGFFVIIDSLFNLIQIISQYSSGVDIGFINCINVDENGQFYMLENRLTDGKLRFIMLNNILIKMESASDYSVVIRRAYDVPNTSPAYYSTYLTHYAKKIIKATGQSKYLIGGTLDPDKYYYGVFTTELVINVGSSNEWNSLLGDTMDIYVEGIDLYCNWDGDNYYVILLAFPDSYDGIVYLFQNSEDDLAFSVIDIDFRGFDNIVDQSALILNDEVGYYALTGIDAGIYNCAIYELDFKYKSSLGIYLNYGDVNVNYEGVSPLTLFKKENEVYFLDIKHEKVSNDMKFTFKVGRIRDDYPYNIYKISTKQMAIITKTNNEMFNIINLNINKQFNLYNFNLLIDDTCYNTYQVYNKSNYNGESFIDKKCLLPNQGVLYDSNDDIIFARNLYNKVISGGTTTSSVEIPNNLLNDITISTKDLWSYNNNVLVSDTEDFVKNQYETVDINFINTIDMINENDENNPVLNPLGATRLNNSMSNDVDYNQALIGKIRLNYSDNTTYIKTISPASRISQFVYQYNFNVYVPSSKSVNSVDMISYDENTIYQTIDTTSLLRGKTYKISQNVEIQ